LYKEVVTEDGSVTFFNDSVSEHYHSLSGAEEEARKKYAELVLKFLPGKDDLVIFDVCFGLGYNSAAVIDLVKGKELRFYCFENDKGILGKVPLLSPDFRSFSLVKEFVHNFLMRQDSSLVREGVFLNMVFGDVKDTLLSDFELADFVLFDPFSPSKCPDLWSEDVFKSLFDKMNPGALLFTYSCARKVRDNMVSAGFEVFDGPVVGRRSPGTVAKKPVKLV
jgi:predicted methyltransferase